MNVIGITGPSISDNSTVAMHLIDAYGYADYAFDTPIHRGMKIMFGLTDDQLFGDARDVVIQFLGVSPHELFQTIRTDWGMNIIANDVWVRLAQVWLQSVPRFMPGAVFSDVRFEDEAEFIRRNGGVLVHIGRHDVDQVNDHISESGVGFQSGDLRIENNGTIDDLYAKIDGLIMDCVTCA